MGFGDLRVLKVADKLSKGGRYFTEQQLACSCLKFTFAVVALLGAASAIKLADDSEPEGRNMDTARW
jgi:hypothetical protein